MLRLVSRPFFSLVSSRSLSLWSKLTGKKWKETDPESRATEPVQGTQNGTKNGKETGTKNGTETGSRGNRSGTTSREKEAKGGDENTENVVIVEDETGLPTNRVAVARSSNIKGSVKKMTELLHRVRGLPVDEAIRQMGFHMKFRRAKVIGAVIKAARTTAVNCMDMDPKRLYVAEAITNRDSIIKRIQFHAKGKTGVLRHRYSNLIIKVKEWSEEEMEKRCGRFGTQTDQVLTMRKQKIARRIAWLKTLSVRSSAAKKAKNALKASFTRKRAEQILAASKNAL